jgi:hypothetical protein
MRQPAPDRYFIGSFLLILLGCIFMVISALTDRRDLTTAAVILSAAVLFLAGILLFTFSKRESLDEKFVSMLPVQGMINLCRVAADLGIAGSACFLPGKRFGQNGVMQLMPAFTYEGGDFSGEVFVSGTGGVGILVPPSSHPLQEVLARYSQVVIPGEPADLTTLIHEICVENLEVAGSVGVNWSDGAVSIRMDGYRLIEGCRRVAQESPACCRMYPCPVCSLCAGFIAEGLNRPVQVDRCLPEAKRDTVQVSLSLLP